MIDSMNSNYFKIKLLLEKNKSKKKIKGKKNSKPLKNLRK